MNKKELTELELIKILSWLELLVVYMNSKDNIKKLERLIAKLYIKLKDE